MYDYKATGATILHSVRRFVLLEDVDEDEGRSNEELESARTQSQVCSTQVDICQGNNSPAYTLRTRTRIPFFPGI